jgi:hypothetical protein
MRITFGWLVVALAATLIFPTLAFGQVSLGGYVQERFTDVFGAADTNKVSGYAAQPTFSVRRARISAKVTIDPRTSAAVEIDATKSLVELKKAYASYTATPALFVTVGRTNLPFGYENPTSSSVITPLDRSMISNNAMPEYANGLLLTPIQSTVKVKSTLSIVNGDDPSAVGTANTTSGSVTNNPYDNPNNNLVTALTLEHKLASGDAIIGTSGASDGEGHNAVDF